MSADASSLQIFFLPMLHYMLNVGNEPYPYVMDMLKH